LLEAVEVGGTENILEVSQELEWVNLSVMYSSLYIIKSYLTLSNFSWVTVDILSAPSDPNWDRAI
jgi:hypothetical protein